jgi:hypothetical protein
MSADSPRPSGRRRVVGLAVRAARRGAQQGASPAQNASQAPAAAQGLAVNDLQIQISDDTPHFGTALALITYDNLKTRTTVAALQRLQKAPMLVREKAQP